MRTTLLTACLMSLLACGDDGGAPADATQEGKDTTPAPTCDPTLKPVIMLHGFLAAADTWTSFARRFEANGYCASHIYAMDWNTLKGFPEAYTALTALVDEALANTGRDQVDLIAHSAGGRLAYAYLADAERAAKVSTYVHIASDPKPLEDVDSGPAGPAEAPVPTLNLTSTTDKVIPSAKIPGALNLTITGEDHYQTATSERAFEDVFTFLRAGLRPSTTEISEAHPFDDDLPRVVSGKALTIGENIPVAGWTVTVFEVERATGARVDATPEATFTVAADGSWGPFDALPETYYEFLLTGPDLADRPVHYYREPFAASNRFLRLRALPLPGSLVSSLFAIIPYGTEHANVIAFTESQAVVNGRDTLTVAGETLSTAELMPAERTVIATFLFDKDTDQTSGGEIETFKTVSPVFLAALDRFIPADDDIVTLVLNGRKLNVPAWASSPDGAIVATFD